MHSLWNEAIFKIRNCFQKDIKGHKLQVFLVLYSTGRKSIWQFSFWHIFVSKILCIWYVLPQLWWMHCVKKAITLYHTVRSKIIRTRSGSKWLPLTLLSCGQKVFSIFSSCFCFCLLYEYSRIDHHISLSESSDLSLYCCV